ncbi:hypothetical protein SS7213T_02498, partial [Staphylococcus simiae CCM 7213 = CCUG 51256]
PVCLAYPPLRVSDDIVEAEGRLDILINNAGAG